MVFPPGVKPSWMASIQARQAGLFYKSTKVHTRAPPGVKQFMEARGDTRAAEPDAINDCNSKILDRGTRGGEALGRGLSTDRVVRPAARAALLHAAACAVK